VTPAEKRKALKAHYALCDAICAANEAVERDADVRPVRGRVVVTHANPLRPLPSFPDALRDMTCGALNRRGEPCKRIDLGRSGRCKFHGGMSTGPTSSDGRDRALGNLKYVGAARSKPMKG
jgi:hypothetical protein